MNKPAQAFLLFLATSLFKGFRFGQSGHIEMARLKMSLMYLRSINTTRLLFISLLSMGVCLVLLWSALALLYISLFLYAPWSPQTKMLVGLTSSGVYFIAVVVILANVFASDKWLKIFHADAILEQLNKEPVPEDEIKPVE